MVNRNNTLSPADAMSLNKGCEERPSRRKGGWEAGTEGVGAGAGPPGKGKATHQGLGGHRHSIIKYCKWLPYVSCYDRKVDLSFMASLGRYCSIPDKLLPT